eukprot:4313970-Pyramimonas_sp.AAC.1
MRRAVSATADASVAPNYLAAARAHARASAAAEMRQPAASAHRNRRHMCFANQVAGGCAGRLREQWSGQLTASRNCFPL